MHFKELKALVETQTKKKVKTHRTDNGLEFCSNEFKQFCKQNGNNRHLTVRGTPQKRVCGENEPNHNGKCEMHVVKCIFAINFLGEICIQDCVLDQLSSSIAIELKNSMKMWSGNAPNLIISEFLVLLPMCM